jgi:hypothetical protein
MGILRYDKKRGAGYVSPWDAFDDMGWWLGTSYTTGPIDIGEAIRSHYYDPTKYELRPREEYKKTLIENKQKEIESLLKEKERLEEELKELKKDL